MKEAGPKKDIGMAIIAYVVFFVPLLTEAKDDPYVKFHVKQGLALFLAFVTVWLFTVTVPIFGWILGPILQIILVVLLIIGIVNASQGIEKNLPFIGSFAEYFKF